MKLPKYVFVYPASDLPGAGYILHTENPLIFGRVLKFKKEQDYLVHVANFEGVHREGVRGHNIDIVFAGSIGLVRVDPSTKDTIKRIIGEMADYYYRERIAPAPAKFSIFRS